MFIVPIELPKVRESNNKTNLDRWVRFIKEPEVVGMDEQDEAIKKAKKVLEEISEDEHERYLAELREKYILDKNSIEYGAKEEGRQEGIKEGREEGAKENSIKIAQKMKDKKIDIHDIMEFTGLTKEEIEKL